MDALLPLLACPVTGDSDFRLEGAPDDGLLRSGGGRLYPVIGGVPRLLPPDLLLPFLREVYPAVLARHGELAAQLENAEPAESEVLRTMVDYAHQHVALADSAPLFDDWRATWARFQPGLPPESLAGLRVLDAGCGEGRHTWVVGEHAALAVGMDLSLGIEVARSRDQHPHAYYVQADLRRPPFRRGTFDLVYSNGVLHHTPDPGASFAAIAPLAAAGGRVSVWVYGLDEMRWTYRVSHLTWLRPLTNRLPRRGRDVVADALTMGAEVTLWTPTRLLRRVGLTSLAERIPYHDAARMDLTYKRRRMLDRLTPPITHYPSRGDVREWFRTFDAVEVINTDGQGWTGRGRVPLSRAASDPRAPAA